MFSWSINLTNKSERSASMSRLKCHSKSFVVLVSLRWYFTVWCVILHHFSSQVHLWREMEDSIQIHALYIFLSLLVSESLQQYLKRNRCYLKGLCWRKGLHFSDGSEEADQISIYFNLLITLIYFREKYIPSSSQHPHHYSHYQLGHWLFDFKVADYFSDSWFWREWFIPALLLILVPQ